MEAGVYETCRLTVKTLGREDMPMQRIGQIRSATWPRMATGLAPAYGYTSRDSDPYAVFPVPITDRRPVGVSTVA